jgi:anti-anti-sigma factor
MARDTYSLDTPITRNSTFAQMRFEEGVLTVRFTGPNVSERESSIVGREVNEALEAVAEALRVLVLDFREVQMISSMGVGMCIDSRNHAKRFRAPTVLFGLTRQLTELFRMMKLNRLYTIIEKRSDLERLLAA